MKAPACAVLAAWLWAAAPAAPADTLVRAGGRDYLHTQWSAADGVPAQISSMAQTTDGWLWIGTYDGLYRFDGLRFLRYPLPPRHGQANDKVTHLHAGPARELYMAFAAEGLALLRPDGDLQYLAPPGDPAVPVRAMAADTDGSLWIINDGIRHFAGGRWHSVDPHAEWRRSDANAFALDGSGVLWAVNDSSTLRLDRRSGRFERIAGAGGDLAQAPDGRIWLVRDDGAMQPLGAAGGAPAVRFGPAQDRYSAQFAPDGTLWTTAGCPDRLCLLPDAGRAAAARRDVVRDAVRLGGAARVAGQNVRSVLVDMEGNTWISSENGLDRYRPGDASAVQTRPFVAAAAVLRVVTDAGEFAPPAPAVLPAGTDRFRIEYSAAAPGAPERVSFSYRLDGVDRGWVQAGTRRAISYSNVGPGDYRFRVRALGADGSAAGAEAVLALTIAPTLAQSAWFRLLCAAALALAGTLLYRWRIRRLSARLAETLRLKHFERERIARTLHDSFLQTVQGLVLRVDAVAASMPPGDRARGRLEAVLGDAGDAIGEGRAQLQELRANEARCLDELLRAAIARIGAHGGPVPDLRIEGQRRPVRPEIADEALGIAGEALRNACLHAAAGRIAVTLAYGRRTLVLTVADDGVGIPDEVLRAGARAGHWGLPGMRERARRIGARLDIGAGAAAGTRISLSVPAAQAYGPPPGARSPR